MAIPGYAAEASLYKTTWLYRGYSGISRGDAGSSVVAQQLTCEQNCEAAAAICVAACFPFNPLCLAACFAGLVVCQAACPPFPGGVGGGGGTGGPCRCPRGTRCCGGCTKVPGQGLVCNGDCIEPGEECP